MVNDFLKKYQEELISEKIQLKEDIDILESKIKEENKFLNLLEESNESYFKEFTPRDINAKNNKKAEEIRQLLSGLQNDYQVKIDKMQFYNERLSEVNELISNSVFTCEPVIDTSVEEEFTDTNIDNIECDNNDNQSIVVSNIIPNSDLIASLSNIKDLILLDPYRAQIELEKIISTI